ncbi:MAG: SPW repeat protein [Candidatus Magasanikbacteria bacterium]
MPTTMQQQRMYVKTTSGVDIVAGVWLILSPFILSFTEVTSALWNSIIFGIAVIALSALRETEEGTKVRWPSWTNAVIGLWLVLSPFILGFTDNRVAYINTLVLGIIVLILASWGALYTPKETEDM